MRVNTLQGKLGFKRTGGDVSQDQTWVDPIGGLLLRSPAEHRLQVKAYAEIGGFGAGSDLTWQFFPTVGFKFNDRVSMEVGYRWLDLDYEDGEGNQRFAYDVLTQGPVAGLSIRF